MNPDDIPSASKGLKDRYCKIIAKARLRAYSKQSTADEKLPKPPSILKKEEPKSLVQNESFMKFLEEFKATNTRTRATQIVDKASRAWAELSKEQKKYGKKKKVVTFRDSPKKTSSPKKISSPNK